MRIKLALGAFRTSPVENIYADGNEAPLNPSSVKLQSCPSDPAFACTIHPNYNFFAGIETAISSFGIRIV